MAAVHNPDFKTSESKIKLVAWWYRRGGDVKESKHQQKNFFFGLYNLQQYCWQIKNKNRLSAF
jgi:hypothetical protein